MSEKFVNNIPGKFESPDSDIEEINFADETECNNFVVKFKQEVTDASELARTHLRRYQLGETWDRAGYRARGLQAAAIAQANFAGIFKKQSSKLLKIIELNKYESEEKIDTSIYENKLTETIERIRQQIDVIHSCVDESIKMTEADPLISDKEQLEVLKQNNFEISHEANAGSESQKDDLMRKINDCLNENSQKIPRILNLNSNQLHNAISRQRSILINLYKVVQQYVTEESDLNILTKKLKNIEKHIDVDIEILNNLVSTLQEEDEMVPSPTQEVPLIVSNKNYNNVPNLLRPIPTADEKLSIPQPIRVLSSEERIYSSDEMFADLVQQAETIFQEVNRLPARFPENEHQTINAMFDNLRRMSDRFNDPLNKDDKSQQLVLVDKVVQSITDHVTNLKNEYNAQKISAPESGHLSVVPEERKKVSLETVLVPLQKAEAELKEALIRKIKFEHADRTGQFPHQGEYADFVKGIDADYRDASLNYKAALVAADRVLGEKIVLLSRERIAATEKVTQEELASTLRKRIRNAVKILALGIGLAAVPAALGDGTAAEAPSRATTIQGFDTLPGQPGHFRITNIPQSQTAPVRVLQPHIISVPSFEKLVDIDTDPMMPSDPLTPQLNPTQTGAVAASTNESMMTEPTLTYPAESSVIPAFASPWSEVLAVSPDLNMTDTIVPAAEAAMPETYSMTAFDEGENLWTIAMGETRVGMLRSLTDATATERIAVWEHVREQIDRDENLRITLGFTTDADTLVYPVPLDMLDALFAETLVHVRLGNTPVAVESNNTIPATDINLIGGTGESGSSVSGDDIPRVESGLNAGTPLSVADTEKYIANYHEGADGFKDRMEDWVKKKLGVHAVKEHRFLSWLSAEQFQDPYKVLHSLSVGEVLSIDTMSSSARDAKLASMHITPAGFAAVVGILRDSDKNPTLATSKDDMVAIRFTQIFIQDIK